MEIEWILSACLGFGLATATGFRIFIPLLLLSLASHYQIIPLQENWEWVGSIPALILLGTGTIVELLAYYIPWVDNILDTVSVPLAGIAGTVVMLATMSDVAPWITWSLALIAGGGTAALVAGTTSVARAASTATTGGLANPLVSTTEAVVSSIISIISIFIPILAVVLVILILFWLFRWKKNRKNKELNSSI